MLALDALVSVANVVYLFSYLVRDILWLRILTVVGGIMLMPYYYFQAEPLWAPIGWNLVFLAINIYWITKLFLERRPVSFSSDERRLYRLAFRTMKERDALALFKLGAWSSQSAGTTLLTQHEPVDTLSLVVDGEVAVEMDGEPVDTLGEGRFLGGIAFLSRGEPFASPVTVTSSAPTRTIMWKCSDLDAAFAKNANLEVAIESILGLEIARFLQTSREQQLRLRLS